MRSRIDLTRQYLEHGRNQATDAMLAMMADDVAISTPMTGFIKGKDALAAQMATQVAGAGALGNITWTEPEEDGEGVKIVGTGSPFGPIRIVLTYDADDKIRRIDAGFA